MLFCQVLWFIQDHQINIVRNTNVWSMYLKSNTRRFQCGAESLYCSSALPTFLLDSQTCLKLSLCVFYQYIAIVFR